MKILLIVDTYFPSMKSAAKHFRDLAIELKRVGHEPVVLTPCDDILESYQCSVEEGVEIVRFQSARLKHPNLALRALREGLLSIVAWSKVKPYFKANRFDLIIYYSPTIFWAPLVWRLKRLWRVPAYLLLRDIVPQWMIDTGLLRRGPAYYLLRAAEKFQYSVSDVIAVQSDGDIKHFDDAPAHIRSKLDIVYNWAPTDEGTLPRGDYRKRLGLVEKIIFFYGGTFGHAQDMDSILRLASEMRQQDDVFFLLVGSGTQLARMELRVRAEGLGNVRIMPGLGQLDYLALVSEIDIGMISLSSGLKTHNIPGKILGYAYFAKPVLAKLNPGVDLGRLLKDYDAGLSSETDFEEFKAHAQVLADDSELRARMGRNNRRLLEEKFSSVAAVKAILGRVSQP